MASNSYSLKEAFTNYLSSNPPEGIQAEVAGLLVKNALSTNSIAGLCTKYGASDPSGFKTEMLDLVLFYIKWCLQDHQLSPAEKIAIEYLKGILKIEEGDFYNLKLKETKELLTQEIIRILDDKNVDTVEALYKVDLQRIFGLSYDQFIELTSDPVYAIVDDLIAKITADEVVTVEESREFLRQILALDTVYKLNPIQKKMINDVQH